MAQNKEYASTRPPICNLNKFALWQARIRLYMNSIDEDIYNSILTGPPQPIASTSTSTEAVPPPEWTDAQKRLRHADAKAMNILVQTMSDDIFQKVADCSSAKEIWETLTAMVAGSADERKDRRSHLISQYENFKKGETESVADMYTRLSLIINELRTLQKDISLTEINDKILMCFPSTWDSRIWPIREARSVNEITTETLLGKLKSYEQLIRTREAEQLKEKNIAFQAKEDEQPAVLKLEENEELMSLLAKRFYKIARKDFRRKSSRNDKPRYDKTPSKEIICFGCRKPGHIITECPENQKAEQRKEKDSRRNKHKSSSNKYKRKEKGFVAAESWSETDSASSFNSSEDEKEESTKD